MIFYFPKLAHLSQGIILSLLRNFREIRVTTMTTDLIQNIMLANKGRLGAPVDLTREPRFLDGSHDIFDLLDGKHQSTNNFPLPKNVTDLLRAAYDAIETAEKTIANQNKRIQTLEGLLTLDELTGLHNRRGFTEALTSETDRMKRGQSEGGLLIMIDLDRFKTLNDTYGHAAGDEALRVVGQYLQSQIRDMDTAARLGGDEFVLLLPNTNKKKAFKRAQSIRDGLNALAFTFGDKILPIHASLGLKDYTNACSISDVLHEADLSLYENKKQRKEQK